jgi:crossover junction endodeoxyribonuclease RusA
VITLELPFPPSVNHYWGSRIVGSGKKRFLQRYIAEPGKKFRRATLETCLVLNPGKLSGPLSATVDLYPPCNRRRDVDNYNKGLLDALGEAGLYEDDSQIIDLRIRMHPKKPPGCVIVTLQETSGIQNAHAQARLVS